MAEDHRENILLVGRSGNRQTHRQTALGLAACAQGRNIRYFPVTELLTLLVEAQEERSLLRLRHERAMFGAANESVSGADG